MERNPPGAAIAGAKGSRALVDAHDHAGDVATITVVERDGVSALKLASVCCCAGRLRWRLIGSVLVATICTVIALHRQARDLPGSLGAFFQDRRLRVPHGDD